MDRPPSKTRAFLALPLDPEALLRVCELMRRLGPELRGVRWVRDEGVHLTLRFLGYATAEALAQVGDAVARAAEACPPVTVPLGPLGMFPERGAPRVLWLHVGAPPEVLELQRACERAAVRAGFEAEERAFRAHVTLGRWRERSPRPSLPDLDLGRTRLDRLVLFRSDLRRAGAVYTPLRTLPLGASPVQ